MVVRLQDLVDLLLSLLVDVLLVLGVAKASHDVVHGREVIVALPLGTQADLVAVVLDLGLVPERYLDLEER